VFIAIALGNKTVQQETALGPARNDRALHLYTPKFEALQDGHHKIKR